MHPPARVNSDYSKASAYQLASVNYTLRQKMWAGWSGLKVTWRCKTYLGIYPRTLCHNQTTAGIEKKVIMIQERKRLFRTIKKGDPPVEAACPSLWQAAEAAHNRNSNLRIDNSHRNRDHCSHLDNPHNRNSRNHNL